MEIYTTQHTYQVNNHNVWAQIRRQRAEVVRVDPEEERFAELRQTQQLWCQQRDERVLPSKGVEQARDRDEHAAQAEVRGRMQDYLALSQQRGDQQQQVLSDGVRGEGWCERKILPSVVCMCMCVCVCVCVYV